MRALIDRLVGALSRLVLGLFFRRVEVVGRDHLPAVGSAPIVVVANHVNGLVDPLFLLGTLRLPARLLGKATLWRIPVLAQILELAAVIPIQRRQDAQGTAGGGASGPDASRNDQAFERAYVVLARRGVIGLFPEGVSHDQPHLQPLRTGAARIVRGAEARFGPLGTRIVPVGLFFDDRGRFRSRALVVVGQPVDPTAEELAPDDGLPQDATRTLTRRVATALEAVTLNADSWLEARWIERGAEIVANQPGDLPRRRRLAVEFAARKAVAAGYDVLAERAPEALAAAVASVKAYDRLLDAAHLEDEQVIARYPWRALVKSFALRWLRALVELPLAVVGAALNLLPYVAVELVARRVRDEPNQLATYKIFPGILIYPAAWIAEAAWAAHGFESAWAWLLVLAAPFTGWLAARFVQRLRFAWREGRAALLSRTHRGLLSELRLRRSRVLDHLEALEATLADRPPGAGAN